MRNLLPLLLAFGAYGSSDAFAQERLPVGTVIAYPGKIDSPTTDRLRLAGWLVCDGRQEDVTAYDRNILVDATWCPTDTRAEPEQITITSISKQ
jgi:hypothetical protein